MTATDTETDARALYLDLLKQTLTGAIAEDNDSILGGVRTSGSPVFYKRAADAVGRLVGRFGFEVAYKKPYDPKLRAIGRDWPARADSMIGLARMDNIQHCVETVLRDQIPGDLIETGVWRGGAVILMRAVLKAYGDTNRVVWAADSFEGLPKPDAERFPADEGDRHWTFPQLVVSLEEVRANVGRYGLLDEQIRFLPGWFRDTLPTAPIERLSVLRLDGDMYESTFIALDCLYPKLSPGGFVIVDDYSCVPQCKAAVDEFRAAHGIADALRPIDWTAVYWQRSGSS
jgi:O-methyltransferase